MPPIFSVRNIVKRYRNKVALDAVSVDIEPGSIFGLLGPNGAGKTTLIRIMTRINAADSGHLDFKGEAVRPEHIQRIGYLPEERGLYRKMKVGEQCLYLARLKGLEKKDAEKRLRSWLERFEIEEWWNRKVEELSKGMAQKLQFITTVVHEPELLILDEPFSGFDPINAERVKEEILAMREKGVSIVLSTHNMNSVEEICETIALIDEGKLVLSGDIRAIKDSYSEKIYDIHFKGQLIGFTNALWTDFELIHKEGDGDRIRARVKLLGEKRLNELLQAILPVVEVQEVQEVVPRMQDIFIKAVGGKDPEKGEIAEKNKGDE
ncbi:MAG: ABC transporter ATP-binding protein [Flavobacteriales bacterium]